MGSLWSTKKSHCIKNKVSLISQGAAFPYQSFCSFINLCYLERMPSHTEEQTSKTWLSAQQIKAADLCHTTVSCSLNRMAHKTLKSIQQRSWSDRDSDSFTEPLPLTKWNKLKPHKLELWRTQKTVCSPKTYLEELFNNIRSALLGCWVTHPSPQPSDMT